VALTPDPLADPVPDPPPTIRPAEGPDRAWIEDLLERSWGSTTIVSRGRAHRADLLPALVAEAQLAKAQLVAAQRGLVGLATYHVEGDEAELVTLDAEPSGRGTGGALLSAVLDRLRAEKCRRMWLITTNDNLDAMGFYQRRGLRLVGLYPGAVDEARLLKPSIPLIGDRGIPIHDEIELAIDL
jgi:GNAT superfamily N-acetyltransferase